MHCLGISWVLDLQTQLSLILFSYHHITTFHHISLVVLFISSSLFYLLLVLLHILFTLSDDPPRFITWRIVTLFSLSIPQTLIQRSLVWEGHLVRESFCYLSTWECVYPLLISSLGFICLCLGYVHLYIKKNERKRKITTCVYVHSILHHWVCILISKGYFIKYVCWWEFVCELSEILFFFVFTLSCILKVRWVTS